MNRHQKYRTHTGTQHRGMQVHKQKNKNGAHHCWGWATPNIKREGASGAKA